VPSGTPSDEKNLMIAQTSVRTAETSFRSLKKTLKTPFLRHWMVGNDFRELKKIFPVGNPRKGRSKQD
jgi:hypothetical protein